MSANDKSENGPKKKRWLHCPPLGSCFDKADQIWRNTLEVFGCKDFHRIQLSDELRRPVEFLVNRAMVSPSNIADRTFRMALWIYEDDQPMRHELEARLLAEQSDQEIAACLSPSDSRITDEVIRVYEKYFFNVRSRRNATDWLVQQAIRVWPGQPHQVTERDVWCFMGYYGGSANLDLVLDTVANPRASTASKQFVLKLRHTVRSIAGNFASAAEVRKHYATSKKLLPKSGPGHQFLKIQFEIARASDLARFKPQKRSVKRRRRK